MLASDRKDTYVMYIYGDGQMNWPKSSVPEFDPLMFQKARILIGYTVKGGLYHNVDSYSFTDLALDIDQYAETSGIHVVCLGHLSL